MLVETSTPYIETVSIRLKIIVLSTCIESMDQMQLQAMCSYNLLTVRILFCLEIVVDVTQADSCWQARV